MEIEDEPFNYDFINDNNICEQLEETLMNS